MKEDSKSVSLLASGVKKLLDDGKKPVSDKLISDESLDWDLELSECECVPDEDGKVLTSLVRRTYISHLHRLLLRNYQSWFKSYGGGVEVSEDVITRCASQIEKQALRACMLANLYQKSVIQLIKNIKASTELNKLHDDLLASLNSCLKKCDKGIQTDYISSSNNGNTLTKSKPVASSPVTVNSSHDQAVMFMSGFADVSNVDIVESSVTSQSRCNLLTPQPVPNPFSDSNVSIPKFILSYLPKAEGAIESSHRLSNLPDSSTELVTNKAYDPEYNPFAKDVDEKENKIGNKRKVVPRESNLKKRKSSLNKQNHGSLDDRLKKFEEIFGDPCEDVIPDPEPHSQVSKAEPLDQSTTKGNYTKFFSLVSWKLESVAQTCELNRKLLMLPPARMKKIKVRLKRMFGGLDPVTDITAEQFTHCRKRLANIVVFQLTPYFDLGLIGSRMVFKTLAREITRIILNHTYAPDMAMSQKMVDDVFKNGIKYRTLDDVNILCSR